MSDRDLYKLTKDVIVYSAIAMNLIIIIIQIPWIVY